MLHIVATTGPSLIETEGLYTRLEPVATQYMMSAVVQGHTCSQRIGAAAGFPVQRSFLYMEDIRVEVVKAESELYPIFQR